MELLSKSFGVYKKQIFHEVHLLSVFFIENIKENINMTLILQFC